MSDSTPSEHNEQADDLIGGRRWIHEGSPRWNDAKAGVVGAAPDGVFSFDPPAEGELLPGEWWRVEAADGAVLGYGWMDVVWGEGEILLAVAPEQQGKGVGTFILDHLAVEAAKRGLRQIYNIVLPEHPRREEVTAWLQARAFSFQHDDDRLSRKVGGRP